MYNRYWQSARRSFSVLFHLGSLYLRSSRPAARYFHLVVRSSAA
jgi:hypothetical protein